MGEASFSTTLLQFLTIVGGITLWDAGLHIQKRKWSEQVSSKQGLFLLTGSMDNKNHIRYMYLYSKVLGKENLVGHRFRFLCTVNNDKIVSIQ